MARGGSQTKSTMQAKLKQRLVGFIYLQFFFVILFLIFAPFINICFALFFWSSHINEKEFFFKFVFWFQMRKLYNN